MAKSIKLQLRDSLKEVQQEIQELKEGLTRSEAIELGEAVTEEMKRLIAVGKSPIEKTGRFPEYKAVGLARGVEKVARRLSGERKKAAKGIAAGIKSRGYPYSVQDEFPDKKPRPVNLKLSGKFLDSLRVLVEPGAGSRGWTPKVGFSDPLSIDKEEGHATGANGQPKRPIIPAEFQEFTKGIRNVVLEKFAEILARRRNRRS
jgi:hypothetical protein